MAVSKRRVRVCVCVCASVCVCATRAPPAMVVNIHEPELQQRMVHRRTATLMAPTTMSKVRSHHNLMPLFPNLSCAFVSSPSPCGCPPRPVASGCLIANHTKSHTVPILTYPHPKQSLPLRTCRMKADALHALQLEAASPQVTPEHVLL